MVTVPADTPVTIPEDEPTVAVEADPVDHTPPVTVLLNVIVAPAQTVLGPEMIPAVVATFMFLYTLHEPTVYVMVTDPEEMPVTIPVGPTIAMAVELLDQVPPAVALASAIEEPTQTAPLPVMADGPTLTVTVLDTLQPPTV